MIQLPCITQYASHLVVNIQTMNIALKTQLRKGAIEMCVLAILKRADSYTY